MPERLQGSMGFFGLASPYHRQGEAGAKEPRRGLMLVILSVLLNVDGLIGWHVVQRKDGVMGAL